MFCGRQVVPGQRHGVLLLGELYLKDDMTDVSESQFAEDEVEAPHPAESIVIDLLCPIEICFEFLAPRL